MSKRCKFSLGLMVAVLIATVFAVNLPHAFADSASFELTAINTSAVGCGGGNVPASCGTVSLNLSVNTINVSITMASGFEIFGPNAAFGFNVVGSTAGLAVTSLTSGFGDNGSGNVDGWGFFERIVTGPAGANSVGSLSFTVDRDIGFTTVNDIVEATSLGAFFSAHVRNPGTGNTGFSAVVPEPSTFLLLGSGLVGLFGYGWWRRKQEVV